MIKQLIVIFTAYVMHIFGISIFGEIIENENSKEEFVITVIAAYILFYFGKAILAERAKRKAEPK